MIGAREKIWIIGGSSGIGEAMARAYAARGALVVISGRDRRGAWSWWLNFNRLDSDAHPVGFATKLVSAGVPDTAGTVVTGALRVTLENYGKTAERRKTKFTGPKPGFSEEAGSV